MSRDLPQSIHAANRLRQSLTTSLGIAPLLYGGGGRRPHLAVTGQTPARHRHKINSIQIIMQRSQQTSTRNCCAPGNIIQSKVVSKHQTTHCRGPNPSAQRRSSLPYGCHACLPPRLRSEVSSRGIDYISHICLVGEHFDSSSRACIG